MPASPPPLRVYACYIDEVLHTHNFPHPDLDGVELEQELNRQFHAWLEMTAPGAYEAGRVSRIEFSDMFE
jgi:hypothetical protein